MQQEITSPWHHLCGKRRGFISSQGFYCTLWIPSFEGMTVLGIQLFAYHAGLIINPSSADRLWRTGIFAGGHGLQHGPRDLKAMISRQAERLAAYRPPSPEPNLRPANFFLQMKT
jgi:hypothetical protein